MDIETLRSRHPDHCMRAAAIRVLTLDAVANAGSGHSGMPMGMADIATVLFGKHLKFDPKAPHWPDRDRFMLSNGHGSMLLYSVLHLTGYADMTMDEIRNLRQFGSRTPGHPEHGHAAGVETTTGPLGQGLGNAVGFAIAEEMLRAEFGPRIVDHHTYAFAGDGCLMEGISQEAAALAGMQKLSRLIVFFDHNQITIDGSTALADDTDQVARFNASGWHTQRIDGHDPDAIDAAITAAKGDPRPSLIACETHIALGSAAQDTAKGHAAITDVDIVSDARRAYGWTAPPFEIPADIKSQWEAMGDRGTEARTAWQERFNALSDAKRSAFERRQRHEPPKKLFATIRALKKQAVEAPSDVASRKSSEHVLEVVNPAMPETVGGSADLTGSNNTRSGDMTVFSPDNRNGRYIHYGIREHVMAAAMNGIALHGGLRPYGGTFLTFTDYARGAVRLSALIGVPVIYVLTHDSIGLGGDGPTHQPVEHLAMLRATPNIQVFRPADTIETAEAWEIALSTTDRPSVLVLSRQGLPALRTEPKAKNLSERGAYVMAEAEGKRQAILMATGSEVSVAMGAREQLQADGIGTRVVSMPCWELFAAQDDAYRKRILPGGPVRVGIEAAVRMGWDQWLLGERGREAKASFIGMHGFGASAEGDVLFDKFGITPAAAAEAVRALL